MSEYNNASLRKAAFYSQLNLSASTMVNYRAAINSKFLRDALLENCGVLDLFEVTDLDLLWELYSKVNLAPRNISNHRAYSAAIMKYVRFLNNGQKYVKKISANK